MANIKARVDVSISPYLTLAASNNQPAITSGLTSATFPTGYIGGGSYLASIDTSDNNCSVTSVSAVLTSAGSRVQISALAKNGVLILKNSGFEEATKVTAANASSLIEVYKTSSASTMITSLSVDNKDVFVIPMTSNDISTYYVKNANGTALKPVYMEGFFIHDTDTV